MYGQWFRLPAIKMRTAKLDLTWAMELADKAEETEEAAGDTIPLAQRQRLSTDKAWNAFDYLLRRKDFPVSIVFGEEAFPGLDEESDEWGYGPPGYLTPEQVRLAASALSALTPADLVEGITVADLVAEDLYPASDHEMLEWGADQLPDAQIWFAAAAEAGDAVICWID